jgi:hypothetical protein
MLIINKLTVAGGIRRVELYPDTVRVVLSNGVVKVYTDNLLVKVVK